jgi:hypothetical protein
MLWDTLRQDIAVCEKPGLRENPLKELGMASLMGHIHSNIRFGKNGTCEFSLRSGRGLFYIKASGPELLTMCKALGDGDMVYVLSRPGSFLYRQCRRDHVYFQAITILPVEDTPAFEMLLKSVTIEALKGYFDDEQ